MKICYYHLVSNETPPPNTTMNSYLIGAYTSTGATITEKWMDATSYALARKAFWEVLTDAQKNATAETEWLDTQELCAYAWTPRLA